MGSSSAAGSAPTGLVTAGRSAAAQPPRDTDWRPCLDPAVPVLRRSPTQIQVGLDDGIVIEPADQRVWDCLTGLDGRLTLTELSRHSGVRRQVVSRLLSRLLEAGMLSGPAEPLAGKIIRVIGAGAFGSRIARLLVASGTAELVLADPEPADHEVYPLHTIGMSAADALAAELTEAGSWPHGAQPGRAPRCRIRVVSHWSKPDDRNCDLTVVAVDAPECDRVVTESLMADDHPHLVLRSAGRGAVVGPFVLPGRGPCLRCCDLLRCDLSASWAELLPQLSRHRARPLPAAAEWAAATATTAVLALYGGQRPSPWGATLSCEPPAWNVQVRTWPVHPRCGCSGGNSML